MATVERYIPSLRDDESWTSLERDVLACVGRKGTSPAEIGLSIGVSETAVGSVLAMLVAEGKVRISRVELA